MKKDPLSAYLNDIHIVLISVASAVITIFIAKLLNIHGTIALAMFCGTYGLFGLKRKRIWLTIGLFEGKTARIISYIILSISVFVFGLAVFL